MKRFAGYVLALVIAVLITAVAFEAPQAVNAQDKGKAGGGAADLSARVAALETALAQEVADRAAAIFTRIRSWLQDRVISLHLQGIALL